MIKQLELENFRGYKHHVADLGELSVIIGRNNAGKSSFIEAVRILATVVNELRNGKFTPPPPWVPVERIGLLTSLSDVERKSDAFFHKYAEPPAKICARFQDGGHVTVYIGHEQAVHVHATDAAGQEITSRSLARKAGFANISILPQISPIREKETTLQKTYVSKCMETHLASRHFRNQIRYFYEHFDTFCELFDKTWPSVSVWAFDSSTAMREDPLYLMLREDGFVAEVSDFGHGIQMWLQIIWFLSRTNANNIVVLDEPDVYLHPEQQAAIVDLIRGRFRQCILATHSKSIIDRCNEMDILRLDRALPTSKVGTTAEDHLAMLSRQREQVDIGPEPVRTSSIEICVIVYEDAAVSIKTTEGQTVLAVQPDPDQPGEEHKVFVARQPLVIRMDDPRDVEIFINSQPYSLDEYYGWDFAEFTVDLSDF